MRPKSLLWGRVLWWLGISTLLYLERFAPRMVSNCLTQTPEILGSGRMKPDQQLWWALAWGSQCLTRPPRSPKSCCLGQQRLHRLPLSFLLSFGGSLGSDLAPGQEEVTLSGWSSFTMGLSDLKAEGWVSCA